MRAYCGSHVPCLVFVRIIDMVRTPIAIHAPASSRRLELALPGSSSVGGWRAARVGRRGSKREQLTRDGMWHARGYLAAISLSGDPTITR